MKAIYRLVTLLLAPVIALTADSKLVQYRITTTRQDGAVQSILYVKEVERTEASSIVEITYEPRRFGPDLGVLVPTRSDSYPVLRGFCVSSSSVISPR
jgi:hypothetical protein